MPLSPPIATAEMLGHLQLLCREPSISGQSRALDDATQVVTSVLRDCGLDCQTLDDGGAPVVVGRYDAGASRTLLLYSHYDVAPTGPRRAWTTDPWRLTERDGTMYARGVIAKGELVARAAAVRMLIETQTLPFNICMVVEGEALLGSAALSRIAGQLPTPDWLLWNGGSLDANDVPLMYNGVKGLLPTELRAEIARLPLPPTYAASTPNPLWTLTWALSSIKSQFEEVLLEGFYDDVQAPERDAMQALRDVDVGEAERRRAWGVTRFAANVTGVMLPRTESFSPTCNVSGIELLGGDVPSLPQRATAKLQFHLVPDQTPDAIWTLLETHLELRAFTGLTATRLPGGYAPRAAALETAWRNAATTAAQAIYGAPGHVISLAPLPTPASVFAAGTPLIAAGLERPASAPFGPDEQLPIADLERHAHWVAEVIAQVAAG